MTDEVYASIAAAGKGGDGVLTVLKTLTYAAVAKGWHASYTSNYTPETRGGLVDGSTILSNAPVLSPIVDKFTMVIALDGGAFDTYLPALEDGGLFIWNTSVIKNRQVNPEIRSLAVPFNDLALAKGVGKLSNMIVLGVFNKVTQYFSVDELIRGMESYLPVWRRDLIPVNRKILEGIMAADMNEFTQRDQGVAS